ncbi:MAG: phage portal protein [Clostridia bacterium]|nr:phage portal protein [Clostridia bacterium]
MDNTNIERRGLFERIFGRRPASAPAQPSQPIYTALTAYQPAFTTTGGAIYEDALIRATIHAAAKHCSKLKVEFYGHGATALATRLKRPNTLQTWSQFLDRVRTIYDVDNTCVIVPAFDKYGRVNALYPVLPSSCTVVGDTDTPMLAMRFPTGGYVQMPIWEVGILTKFQYRNDFFGDDNRALQQTRQLIDIQNQGIIEATKSAATYRFMASMGNMADPKDLTDIRDNFNKQNFSGSGGGLLLFDYRFQNPTQIKADHYVVDEGQMKAIKANVFDYFGSNEDVLQNKTYGDRWSAYYEGEIEPWSIQLSEVLSDMLRLLGALEGDSGVMATANRLQYMSNADKLNFANQALDRGAINVDEWRDVFNLAPLPDGQGQVYRIRGEYKAADEAGAVNGTVNNYQSTKEDDNDAE